MSPLKTLVVKYLFSTSNHNIKPAHDNTPLLSNTSFLHQTTTNENLCFYTAMLSNTSFLHQTTTVVTLLLFYICCQIPLFYIKPQRLLESSNFAVVVKYLFSTSNHNYAAYIAFDVAVVKYLFSTSNHNTR